MKKITLLLCLCSLVLFSQAQRALVASKTVYDFNAPAAPKGAVVDTIFPENFFTGSPALYTTEGGGYLGGTNEYGDIAKGQIFVASKAYTVEGILVWVGDNALGADAGDLTFSMFAIDNGIGELYASQAVPFEQVSSSTSEMDDFFYSLMFTEPVKVAVADSFAVALSWKLGLTKGFGIISTTTGDANGTNLAIEQWSDNSWAYVASGWELDIDFAIFPLVSYVGTPVANAGADQTVKDLTEVTLDGSASTDATTYKWTAPEGITLSDDTAAKPTFTAPEVSADTDYEFSLVVSDGSVDSEADVVTITVQPGVGIADQNSMELSVYPSPSNGNFVVTANTDAELFVTNVLGQIVLSESINKGTNSVNISGCTNGIYFVTVKDANRTETLRIQISK